MRLAFALTLALALPAVADVWGTAKSKEIQAGNGKDTFNIAIIGDGWDAAHQGEYQAECDKIRDGLLSIDPYSHYKDTFRIMRFDVQSVSQGCKLMYPPDSWKWTKERKEELRKRDTPFGIVWYPEKNGLQGPLVTKATLGTLEMATGTEVPFRVTIVITPDKNEVDEALATSYHGRSYIVMSNADQVTHGDLKGTIAHELGHALFGLDDEYCYDRYGDSTEPIAANTTRESTSYASKWKHIVPTAPVACTPNLGIGDNGLYHPTDSCRMNAPVAKVGYPEGFCPVCLEAISHKVSSSYRLIESWTPKKSGIDANPGDKVPFSVKLRPQGDELKFFWELDGKNLGPAEGKKTASGWTVETTIPMKYPGTHEVRFIVEDQHNLKSKDPKQPTSKAPQSQVWWVNVRSAKDAAASLEKGASWE